MSYGKRWVNLNPYDLHKTLVNEYLLSKGKNEWVRRRDTSNDKRDIDVIRENHKFLWEDDEDESNLPWEKKLAKQYYNKLFKEYCVGDLSRYRENKIGLRWRTEQELIDGKGQFICGGKTCLNREDLKSWEVNFGYKEHGIKKNALVKLRLCMSCSKKLNFHYKRKEIKRLKFAKEKQSLKVDSKKCGTKSGTKNKTPDADSSREIESQEKAESSSIWKDRDKTNDAGKSREQEFDEYLNQLLL